MAVPRNRMSNSRRNTKRAHHAKKPRMISRCSHCGTPVLSHHICSSCGHYGAREVLTVKAE